MRFGKYQPENNSLHDADRSLSHNQQTAEFVRESNLAKQPAWAAPASEIDAVISGGHRNLFGVLGLHEQAKQWIARAFVPGALAVEAETLSGEKLGLLECRHPDGFF